MLAFDTLLPMLLSERRTPFTDPAWSFEIKYDGYRLLAEIDAGRVRLRTKTGSDATKWFPEVCRSLAALPGRQILDGEVCVLDDVGRSDFNRLHARARRRGYRAGDDAVSFMVFDILVASGRDVTAEPLRRRRTRLEKVLGDPPDGIRAISWGDDGEWLFDKVLGLQLEGMIAKRLDSPYLPGQRSADWVKIKRKGAVPAQRFAR